MPGLVALVFGIVAAAWQPPAPIAFNENVTPAGRQTGTVLTVRLFAAPGRWLPEGAKGAPREIAAFGEEGVGLSVPGPLIRVAAGTTVNVTLRNALAVELRVSGLCAKPGACEPIAIAPGATRDMRFSLETPGTYHYWASTTAPLLTARQRFDSQLGGAIVVDPAGVRARDRIFVISMLTDGLPAGQCGAAAIEPLLAINGASWPHTARLRYDVAETVRWRVVNLSCDQHAMHLHGFHFTVDSSGDGAVDRQLPPEQHRTAVTEAVAPGRTFTMSWTPTRSGNWLFHCHMVAHMAAPPGAAHAGHDAGDHAGMAGLVIGIEVSGRDTVKTSALPPRRFSLELSEEPKRYGDRSGYRMDVEGAPRLDAGPVPGPVIVLERDQPTEITVINRMTEPTAIHWHGLEIDSYFDGVPGFGGRTGRISPAVAPGESFVVTLAPPRAGTFIYHTHWHDERQLAGGLYGPLIVLEPGQRYDPATDHIVVIGLNGVLARGQREPFAINGRATPAPIRMRTGVPNRLRLINITAENVALTAFLVDQFDVMPWTPVAKDGATLPPAQSAPRAARQLIAVGETYDFEITPPKPQNLWLEIRRGSGEWVLQVPIQIR